MKKAFYNIPESWNGTQQHSDGFLITYSLFVSRTRSPRTTDRPQSFAAGHIARNGNTSAYIPTDRFLTIFSSSRWQTDRYDVCWRSSHRLVFSLSENAFLSKFLQRRFVDED